MKKLLVILVVISFFLTGYSLAKVSAANKSILKSTPCAPAGVVTPTPNYRPTLTPVPYASNQMLLGEFIFTTIWPEDLAITGGRNVSL